MYFVLTASRRCSVGCTGQTTTRPAATFPKTNSAQTTIATTIIILYTTVPVSAALHMLLKCMRIINFFIIIIYRSELISELILAVACVGGPPEAASLCRRLLRRLQDRHVGPAALMSPETRDITVRVLDSIIIRTILYNTNITHAHSLAPSLVYCRCTRVVGERARARRSVNVLRIDNNVTNTQIHNIYIYTRRQLYARYYTGTQARQVGRCILYIHEYYYIVLL